MEEINLKEILQKHFTKEFGHDGHGEFMSYIIEAMKEACNQTVDLCADNASIEIPQGIEIYIEFDKESILKTKDQIK